MAEHEITVVNSGDFSEENGGISFRRYHRVKNSTRILDAYDYGYKAWPIGKH